MVRPSNAAAAAAVAGLAQRFLACGTASKPRPLQLGPITRCLGVVYALGEGLSGGSHRGGMFYLHNGMLHMLLLNTGLATNRGRIVRFIVLQSLLVTCDRLYSSPGHPAAYLLLENDSIAPSRMQGGLPYHHPHGAGTQVKLTTNLITLSSTPPSSYHHAGGWFVASKVPCAIKNRTLFALFRGPRRSGAAGMEAETSVS